MGRGGGSQTQRVRSAASASRFSSASSSLVEMSSGSTSSLSMSNSVGDTPARDMSAVLRGDTLPPRTRPGGGDAMVKWGGAATCTREGDHKPPTVYKNTGNSSRLYTAVSQMCTIYKTKLQAVTATALGPAPAPYQWAWDCTPHPPTWRGVGRQMTPDCGDSPAAPVPVLAQKPRASSRQDDKH